MNFFFLIGFASVYFMHFDAAQYRGRGFYENGKPFVKINGEVFDADKSREIQVGEGDKCERCSIHAPANSDAIPTYVCYGGLMQSINGQISYKSPCN